MTIKTENTFFVTAFTAICTSFFLSIWVYLLWNNALIGAINGVNSISWVQALGITLLCNTLFTGAVFTRARTKIG